MTGEITQHWHSLTCCEFKVDHPLGRNLFRRLGHAAETLRKRGVADGAISSYATVAGYWNAPPTSPNVVADQMAEVLAASLRLSDEDLGCSANHQVPVRYDGPDVEHVAAVNGLTEDEVIELHSSGSYVVAAIGFMPNFGYLWGLDPKLATPRRASPRPRVAAGAVGIAGEQTGIYPQSSPGGWQLIGHVEEQVCEAVCQRMKIGDLVEFQTIPA